MATTVEAIQNCVSIKLKYCSTKKGMQNLHSKKPETSETRYNLDLSNIKYCIDAHTELISQYLYSPLHIFPTCA